MPGGILFEGDWERLRDSAIRVADRFRGHVPYFLEVGVADGRTARDLIGEIGGVHPESFFYFGVDPAPPPAGMPDPYSHVRARSHEAIDEIAAEEVGGIHWALIDGCHCAACVARDAILYGRLLVPGGELLFHDASPRTQGLDPQTYADSDHCRVSAQAGIQVRKFLDAGLLAGFDLVLPAPDQERGGVEVYRKL